MSALAQQPDFETQPIEVDATFRAVIVDDEPDAVGILRRLLRAFGIPSAEGYTTVDEFRNRLHGGRVDVVFLDLKMPGVTGLELLDEIRAARPEASIVIISAYSTVANAVEAIKRGAFDFFPKPIDPGELRLLLQRVVAEHSVRLEYERLKREERSRDPSLQQILGQSPPMHRLRDWITRVRDTRTNVLIEGETGTGKELIARALHNAHGPFVAVNPAAMPEEMAESELFGHVKGAFTHAEKTRTGLFQEASGGTLFLDEINSMSPRLQAKVLRVVQEGAVRPLGSDTEVPVDVRVISASNEDLEALVEDARFRQDLYFRLRVLSVRAPALRERKEDIPLLADEFLRRYASRHRKRLRRWSIEAANALTQHAFPGNIRELENVVEEICVLAGPDDFEVSEQAALAALDKKHPAGHASPHPLSLAAVELQHVLHIMDLTGGNQSEAARILQIDYKTLLRKLGK